MAASSQYPDPPEYLSDSARDAWYVVLEELASAGIGLVGKLGLVELYAVTWGFWFECQQAIAEEGQVVEDEQVSELHGYEQVTSVTRRNPRMQDLHRMTAQLTSIRGQLGLTKAPSQPLGGEGDGDDGETDNRSGKRIVYRFECREAS